LNDELAMDYCSYRDHRHSQFHISPRKVAHNNIECYLSALNRLSFFSHPFNVRLVCHCQPCRGRSVPSVVACWRPRSLARRELGSICIRYSMSGASRPDRSLCVCGVQCALFKHSCLCVVWCVCYNTMTIASALDSR